MPTFSIIIPMHNSAEYAKKALDSIKSQSFTDYELILVCDNCTDGTVELAKQYTDKVFEVNFGNTGLSRSKGLDESTGKYILFMDDDDWWLHEFVLMQINEKMSDNIDILQFSFIWKDKGYYGMNKLANKYTFSNVWSKCIRREFIGDTRFKNIYYGDDSVFLDELLSKKPRILHWDMPIYYYNWLRKGSQSEIETTKGTLNQTLINIARIKRDNRQ